jgi:hypothetical protein
MFSNNEIALLIWAAYNHEYFHMAVLIFTSYFMNTLSCYSLNWETYSLGFVIKQLDKLTTTPQLSDWKLYVNRIFELDTSELKVLS